MDFLSRYLQYIIEGGITLLVLGLQVKYFRGSRKRISEFENIFPAKSLDERNIDLQETEEGKIRKIKVTSSPGSVFSEIVESVNSYVKKNRGTADFTIVKNIVERSVESEENDVSANMSLPLYIGLMGTFIGIVVGLVKIAFFGGVTSENIDSFLGGVFIAMVASFVGLLLTVINNSQNFRRAKRQTDFRKNAFLRFLENELLPTSGNSIAAVLERFRNNISDFNEKFEKNIDRFDSEFSKNINSLKAAASEFSASIGSIIVSTTEQKELLKELKGIGFQDIVKNNLELFKKMNESVPSFLHFVDKQKELSKSIEGAVESVKTVETILNRLKRFEEAVNSLGDRIHNADYMGSDLLEKVNKKLNELDRQFELLKQHGQTTSGTIELHYIQEVENIKNLSGRLLSNLEESLNFDIEKNPLKKLEILESIEALLKGWKENAITQKDFEPVSLDVNATKVLVREIQEGISEFGNSKGNIRVAWERGTEDSGNGRSSSGKESKVGLWKRVKRIFTRRKKANGR